MTKELLQQALDALRQCEFTSPPAQRPIVKGTITALRSALAAPMPEPVAWLCENAAGHRYFRWKKPMSEYKPVPLYAAPPAAPADMADDGGCPVCGEDGGTSCGMPNCGLLQGAAPATSADYAMGYAEGFNDACKPAPAVPDWMHRIDEILSNAIVSRTDAEIVDAARLVFIEGWESKSAAPVVREPVIDEMDAIASQYAHKLALDLECVLSDYNGKWWDTAMQTIGEYRMAMNRIHERESPTHMGEPVLPKISSGVGK